MRNGIFITFEGGESSGKSTQVNLLKKYLEEKGFNVLIFAEPGGTKIGKQLRNILLEKKVKLSPLTELFLFLASRRQLITEKIEPALKKKRIVICDRFLDSTTAYQGYGRGIKIEVVEQLNHMVVGGTYPHLTFILDTEKPLGLKKKDKDRIEKEKNSFHRKIRRGYQEIARKNPERVRLIKGEGESEEIHHRIRRIVDEYLEKLRIWLSVIL